MAKTRTLPDKYYDKDYETNGIHRVPLWRIAGFALNNTATNLYLMFMNYVSFYLLGFVGVGMVMASSFTMAMRIWDGVTDPFIGYMVDKTNGKFGKNRPFMVIGSIGGIICNIILSALWIVGDPTTMTSNPETGALNWGSFLITYVVFSILYAGCQGISGNIVIPMTADCADYEVYRSGKYVPGLMGTLFSFVDKMISSFAPMIAGRVVAACGFTDHNPSVGDIVTPQLRVGVVFLAYGLITIGLICNLIAMKFYPLSKEKMAEIQDEIVKIKAKAMAEA